LLDTCDFVILVCDKLRGSTTTPCRNALITSDGHAYRWSESYGEWVEQRTIKIDDDGARHVSLAVLKLFGSPCPEGDERYCACHKDDDRDNNCIDNLYWGTHAENMRDLVNNGRHSNGMPTPHEVVVSAWVVAYVDGASLREIADDSMMSPVTVRKYLLLAGVTLNSRGIGMARKFPRLRRP
jgi:hypothetical protein